MREASNCSQLRRNFENSQLLIVPEVYWDYCEPEVMVMERMKGVPISQVDTLRAMGVDIPRLASARRRDIFHPGIPRRFFPRRHAPRQYPGQCPTGNTSRSISASWARSPKSIKTTWRKISWRFFSAIISAVAQAHVDAGWTPPDTRVDEFEAAIRAVCEPVFDRPLKEISFGKVLLRLFQTSRRFNMEIQPQLVLLQKTLLNIEGLGRQLDPDLDLWKTAKPFLERWMNEQLGWRGALRRSNRKRRTGPCCCRNCHAWRTPTSGTTAALIWRHCPNSWLPGRRASKKFWR